MEKIKRKNPNAVALGRKGGLKGGKARAEKLSEEELSEQGRNAVAVRWARYREKKAQEAEAKKQQEQEFESQN